MKQSQKLPERKAEIKKEQAERFARNVLKDDDLADSIADENLEEWAERKGIVIENPQQRKLRKGVRTMPTKQQLEDRVAELEAEVDEYADREAAILEALGVETEEDESSEDSEAEDED